MRKTDKAGAAPAEPCSPVRIAAEQLTMVPIDELVPYANNAKQHSPAQISQIRASLREFGFVTPVLIDGARNIIAGHGRVEAARAEGMREVPCVLVGNLTEAQRKAYILADNRLSETGSWDPELLQIELANLDALHFDTGIIGFDAETLKEIPVNAYTRAAPGNGIAEKPPGYRLRDLFLCNPFSVIDCKTSEWLERKRVWTQLGIRSEIGRKDNLSGACDAPDYISGTCDKMAPGTSIFDPALCELMYTWFCPPGGTILDPFSGGSVRGIVAGYLGYRYFGNDLRQEQVDANVANAQEVPMQTQPQWTCGDSRDIQRIVPHQLYDMVFSCPPYADLEIYSDNPADISNMAYDDFLVAYRTIIARTCELLAEDRFAVFVVGDVRDDRGFYRDLISDTKRAFKDCGCFLYNEIIKLDPFGTAGARARLTFSARKVVRVHQHILVFFKGDPRKIKEVFGGVQIPDFIADEMEGEEAQHAGSETTNRRDPCQRAQAPEQGGGGRAPGR